MDRATEREYHTHRSTDDNLVGAADGVGKGDHSVDGTLEKSDQIHGTVAGNVFNCLLDAELDVVLLG
jgi:hypothetical protein